MSDDVEEAGEDKPFVVERAKTGRAKCKKCKCTIEKDELRIGKLVVSFFSDGKLMPAWHHVACLMEVFAKQRATTKRIDDPEKDVKGWEQLSDEDKQLILDKLEELETSSPGKGAKKRAAPREIAGESSKKATGKNSDQKTRKTAEKAKEKPKEEADDKDGGGRSKVPSKDDLFREFRRVCSNVANVDAYTDKTAIIRKMFTQGSQSDGFKGDIVLWCKLLLPGAVKRIYNLQSKQLIKLFARLLLQDEDSMLEHLEQGDIAETISVFFENSVAVSPCAKSVLTIQDVDLFLEELSYLTKEEEQIQHFRSVIDKCTANDLKMIVRLIKHDLRINAGPKHILEGVHEDAYKAFQMSRDLETVIRRFLPDLMEKPTASGSPASSCNKVAISLMTPILPMLAEACTSVEMAMHKCPNGMLSEIKYDGERVQVHKRGNEFRYFSRSLKPVMPHKVNLFKDYIGRAFPDGDDLILDSEVLMIDSETGQPLPFGTLGIHKKAEFKNANVCLFVFDCLYYNGEILINKSMSQRRRILRDRMTEIPNRIMLSEVYEVHDSRDLAKMIVKVLKHGLEGLVLKDINSKYEPGKRHWLKVKKDYLCGGAMADSADLVVLGAWYGTGNKGGMLSIFLMGCYDEERDKWLTVTKVHTGHSDAALAELQNELDMVKIGKDTEKLPSWLLANKPMVPDFVARDPKKQPVWEVTGAEFTNQGVHTADGISIRFPRVTRVRSDKNWSTATTLNELRELFRKKPESVDFSLLLGASEDVTDVKDILIKKPLDSLETSPEKTTTSWFDDEPSTSFAARKCKIKEEPPDVPEEYKGQKKDNHDDSFDSISDERSERKRLKLERGIKKETQDPLVVKKKKKKKDKKDKEVEEESDLAVRKAEKPEDRYVNQPAGGTDVEESFAGETSVLNSAAEDGRSHVVVLKNVRASLAPGFVGSGGTNARKLLRTLGATIVTRKKRFDSTHVIHACTEIPSTYLEDFTDFPKTVKHVSVSWLEEAIARSAKQDEISHAVELAGDYCECPCTHR
ncbi:PREDICTED: DNA ligase 3 [Dinoponera quadriceps]|uniref:DNA ligase n=1 Tax=Dinoponera quadriceps TaxID=609295 RepID=A0A6P3WZZ4_DINQU|nr:PREDICTED: DNA ligase 3 [Dinoponera quadriceps]XP_014471669.1 PREDICTED: DNA ligase 3 [Dinoponera quadriceps]XP_014471670.1 PREDICTED: DNA ligase 3 [Dinoponera quadriceps]